MTTTDYDSETKPASAGDVYGTWRDLVESDGDSWKDFPRVAEEYTKALPIVRAIVDRVIVATCGYSLATVIRIANGEEIEAATAKSPDYAFPLDNFFGSADLPTGPLPRPQII
jgi:hypothetical protein